MANRLRMAAGAAFLAAGLLMGGAQRLLVRAETWEVSETGGRGRKEQEEESKATPGNAARSSAMPGNGAASPSNSRKADEEVKAEDNLSGKEFILPEPVREGYVFAEWNTRKDGTGAGYRAGEIIEVFDMTLYAMWEKAPKGDLKESHSLDGVIQYGEKAAVVVKEMYGIELEKTWIGDEASEPGTCQEEKEPEGSQKSEEQEENETEVMEKTAKDGNEELGSVRKKEGNIRPEQEEEEIINTNQAHKEDVECESEPPEDEALKVAWQESGETEKNSEKTFPKSPEYVHIPLGGHGNEPERDDKMPAEKAAGS